MIKYFRRIRYKLMSENKTSRYFKYAIGEIILVMIGILLALGISNWNEDRLSDQRELVYLKNLRDDLQNNIKILNEIDSVYTLKENETTRGIELFKNNPSIYDFKLIDSLIDTRWMTFPVSRSTFNEMLNNGSFYSLKNKTLKDEIDNHYLLAQRFESAFREINSNGQDITYNPNIYPLELLKDHLNESPINLSDIDTSWIHNPNSPMYSGFYRVAAFYKQTNNIRLRIVGQFSNSCKALIETINNELKNRD